MAINNNYTAEVGIKFNDRQLNRQLKELGSKTVTVNMKLGDGVSRQLHNINKSFNKVTDGTVAWGKSVSESSEKASKSLTTVEKSTKNINKSFYDTSKHADTLGSKFLDITKKVIAFGGVTAIIGLFTKTISEAYQAVKNMDDVMTEFNKVSDMSGESLSKYTDELTEMGESVGRTGAEMLASSTEFVKAGYDEKQSAELAKVANLYMNIADGQVSSAEASALLVSQMKAFNMTADEATIVIDQINEVSNLFAVSSTDISTALTKSSSALATYGNTMSESISLVTAG